MAELVGEAADGLAVEGEAVPGEFLACQVEGGQQGNGACDATDQCGGLSLVKAQDGQLGVEAAAGADTSLDGAWGVVECGDPQDQSTQQTQASRAGLGGSQRAVGVGYFFWASRAQAGAAAAWARRPAAHWSASCAKVR